MNRQTEAFTSPTGSKMLVATYNQETKMVSFDLAKGYLYTSDGNSMTYSMLANEFIRTHKKYAETTEEANRYLTSLGINVHFPTTEDLEGKWTFANLDVSGWVHEAFNTKEDAIREAKAMFPSGDTVVVGQLKKFIDSYHPENQEYVKYE